MQIPSCSVCGATKANLQMVLGRADMGVPVERCEIDDYVQIVMRDLSKEIKKDLVRRLPESSDEEAETANWGAKSVRCEHCGSRLHLKR